MILRRRCAPSNDIQTTKNVSVSHLLSAFSILTFFNIFLENCRNTAYCLYVLGVDRDRIVK